MDQKVDLIELKKNTHPVIYIHFTPTVQKDVMFLHEFVVLLQFILLCSYTIVMSNELD